jgi:hypothetical protein
VVVESLSSLGRPLEVVQRVPVTRPSGAYDQAVITSRVQLTMTSSQGFICAERTNPDLFPCESDVDCGPTGSCSTLGVAACPRRCTTITCSPADPQCIPAFQRACSGVDLHIGVASADLVDPTAGNGTPLFIPVLPDQVILSPIRASWIVSYPGSRGVVEEQMNGPNGLGFYGLEYQ